ncbi:MAG: hypothetical protein IKN79_09180 [Eubacterium sp.]|nr:hypothetical protein [Eubacterium sp.]
MPVCNIDKYNGKVKNNTAFKEQEIDKISELFNRIQDRLDQADDQNQEINTMLLPLNWGSFASKLEDLGKAKNDDDIQKSLRFFEGFKHYLEKKESGQTKTNFQIAYEILKDNEKKVFLAYLKKINSVLETGIDVDSLVAESTKDKEGSKNKEDSKGKEVSKDKEDNIEIIQVKDEINEINEKNPEPHVCSLEEYNQRVENGSVKDFWLKEFGAFVYSSVIAEIYRDGRNTPFYKGWEVFEHLDDLMDEGRTQEALDKFVGFKQFLFKKENGKTNYQRTLEYLNEGNQWELNQWLEKVNGALDLGIDMKALTAKPNMAAGDDLIIPKKADRDNKIVDVHYDQLVGGLEDLNEAPQKTAAQYIKDVRRSNLSSPKDLAENVLKIMAARIIADSVRHKKDRLISTLVTEDQIDDKVSEMKENATYKRFYDDIINNAEFRNKVTNAYGYIKVDGRGHGGRIDDLFREYAKNVPPGELDNSEIMQRYMPSVKDRIEVLQKQFKPHNEAYVYTATHIPKDRNAIVVGEDDPNKLAMARIMIEITKLRTISNAIRKQKSSLEKPIPVSNPTLSQEVSADYSTDYMIGLTGIVSNKARTSAVQGHGGEMVEDLRTECVKSESWLNPRLRKIIMTGSIRERIRELQNEARELSEWYSNGVVTQKDERRFRRDCKNVLAEYLFLDGITRGQGQDAAPQEAFSKDVPSDKVRTLLTRGPQNDPRFRNTFKDYTEEDYDEIMRDMANTNLLRRPTLFMDKLNEKRAEIDQRNRGVQQEAASRAENKVIKSRHPSK